MMLYILASSTSYYMFAMLFSFAVLTDNDVLRNDQQTTYTYIFITCAFVIQFLGCIPKKMTALRYSTLVTAIIVFYVSIVIVCNYFTLRPYYEHAYVPTFITFDMNISLVTCYCLSLFSAVNQFASMNVISELNKPSTRRLTKVICRSAIFPIMIYMAVGVLGYLT